MKRIGLFIIGLVLLGCLTVEVQAQSGRRVAYDQYATNTVPGTPVQLYPATMWVTRATILGKKAARTNNTSTAYVGVTSGNDTQAFPVTAGGEVVIEAYPGTEFNLATWYVDVGTTNDGVIVIFQ